MEPHRENHQSFYFEFVLTPMTTVGHKFISFFVTVTCFRDGPLEELWGGREGNFWAAGIFSVIKFLVWIFVRPQHEYFFRINWRAWIFFHLIFPCANIFVCTSPPPPPPPNKFSNGPSLNRPSPMTLVLYVPWVRRGLMRPIRAQKCLCHIPDRISYLRKHKCKDPTKKKRKLRRLTPNYVSSCGGSLLRPPNLFESNLRSRWINSTQWKYCSTRSRRFDCHPLCGEWLSTFLAVPPKRRSNKGAPFEGSEISFEGGVDRNSQNSVLSHFYTNS